MGKPARAPTRSAARTRTVARLARGALAALLATSAGALRRPRGEKVKTDGWTVGARLTKLRRGGVDIAEDAFRELPASKYKIRIKKPGPLREAFIWAANTLEGSFWWTGTDRFNGNSDFGCKKLSKDKLLCQFGEGRDSGFEVAIMHQLKVVWKNNPPKSGTAEHRHERALREFMIEVQRVRKALKKNYGFKMHYYHAYVHSKTSMTDLHGDGNLTFDDEDAAAARAILTSQPRPLEFVMFNGRTRSGAWNTSDAQRNLGVAYGAVLATASILGGVFFGDAGLCDFSAAVDDVAAHDAADPIVIKHIANRAGAKRVGDTYEAGVALVLSGILLNRV